MADTSIILASSSSARARMLAAAGVAFDAIPPKVDEDAVKSSLIAEGAPPDEIAATLAQVKSVKVSAAHPGSLVIGGDQVLEFKGSLFDKPKDMAEAREHLMALSAGCHQLISAVVISENGQPVFRAVKSVTLHMRPLSEEFLDAYLDQAGQSITGCVGGYQLEGLGAQLFYRIDGDYFVVLGLPLLDTLGYLRERGHLLA